MPKEALSDKAIGLCEHSTGVLECEGCCAGTVLTVTQGCHDSSITLHLSSWRNWYDLKRSSCESFAKGKCTASMGLHKIGVVILGHQTRSNSKGMKA